MNLPRTNRNEIATGVSLDKIKPTFCCVKEAHTRRKILVILTLNTLIQLAEVESDVQLLVVGGRGAGAMPW